MTRSFQVVSLLGAGALALVPAASARAGTIEAQCGSKSGSYLFWPRGHDARPGVGFPAFPTPHLELYRGQRTSAFPDGAQDAYIDSSGAAGAAKHCRSSAAGFVNAGVNHARTVRSEANVVCNFKGLVSYRIGKVSGGSRLQTVLSGGGVVVDVRMGRSGSSLRFDKRYCKAHASPR